MIRNRSIFMRFYCIFSLSLCLFDKNLNEQQSQWIVTRFDQYQFNDLINFFFFISCNYFWCLFSSSANKRRWTLKCMCDLFVFLLIKIENSSSNNSKKKMFVSEQFHLRWRIYISSIRFDTKPHANLSSANQWLRYDIITAVEFFLSRKCFERLNS